MASLTGKTRLAGVMGWPVSHSRSPRLQNYWLARYGIDGAYVPLPVAPERFEQAVQGLRACGFAGANVTIPHKQAAHALCDAVDDAARRSGSVNTLIFDGDRILGRDTDGFGFLENLRAHAVDIHAGPALILGAGGAGRAIAANLLHQGVTVRLLNRSAEKAEQTAKELPGLEVLSWADRHAALTGHALLVNATSAGMSGTPGPDLDITQADPGLAVADLIYVPAETPLLAAARARGLRCVGGLGMLLHQARPGFSAWFGVEPAVDADLIAYMDPNTDHGT